MLIMKKAAYPFIIRICVCAIILPMIGYGQGLKTENISKIRLEHTSVNRLGSSADIFEIKRTGEYWTSVKTEHYKEVFLSDGKWHKLDSLESEVVGKIYN